MTSLENKKEERDVAKEAMVHTYNADLAEEIKNKQGQALKAVLENERAGEEQSPSVFKNMIFIILGVLFFLGAFVLLFLGLQSKDVPTFPVPTNDSATTNEFNSQKEMDITKMNSADLILAVQNELSDSLQSDMTKNVYFIRMKSITDDAGNVTIEKQKVPIKDVLYLLNVKAPELFLKAIGSDFYFGAYGCGQDSACEKRGGNQSFLVLQTDFPNNAYRGAMDWEGQMLLYGYQFLNLPISLVNSELFSKPFENIVVKNLQARVLTDANGQSLIVYGFWNNKYMIIATDREVYAKITELIQKKL